GQKYKLNWWYPEDYKGLTWSKAVSGLLDPTVRAKLLKYIVYRETLNPLGSRDYYFYVRNDIPSVGPGPAPAATAPEQAPAAPKPERAAKVANGPAGMLIFGRSAAGRPVLVDPKGVAVAPNGRIYVTEGGANRVTAFNSDGSIA